MLAEILERLGEPWCYNHQYDFGLESAKRVADFYNNGGLEFHNSGVNYAIAYAALKYDGEVEIGAWVWLDGEDFDEDATCELYDEDDFSAGELQRIYNRIKEIYGKQD